MIWVDYCILGLTLLSVIIGVIRGFTKEIFGLLSWALAFGLALLFGDVVAEMLQGKIAVPVLRTVSGYAICFLGGLLIGAVSSMLLVESVRNSRLAPIDRTLGGGFGLLRALLIAGLFVMLAGNMGAKEERWWQNSMLIGKLTWLADGIEAITPESWLVRIRPEPSTEPSPAEPSAPQES